MEKPKIDKRSLLLAFLIAALLLTSTILYAAKDLGGNYNWLTLSSYRFGVPEEVEAAYGGPLFNTTNDTGWDGQFYYYIANDLLGLKDTAAHIDSCSYRYQRVGLPLLAKVVSLCLLERVVSVRAMVLANIMTVGAAVYFAAKFFRRRGWSSLWVLPWVCSAGVVISVRHCLPDAAADALVIMAVLAFLEKKDIPYSILMTLACLAREGFVLVAFLLFCMRMLEEFRRCGLSPRKFHYGAFLCFAFPGIVFVGWYLYVTLHFGAFPFTQASGVQDFYLTGWVRFFAQAFSAGNLIELCGLALYGITVLSALVFALLAGRKKHIYWMFVPYIILVSSFGDTVLMHWSGYLKGISFLFFLLPAMLADTLAETTDFKTMERNLLCKQLLFVIAVGSVLSGLLGYHFLAAAPLQSHNAQTIGIAETPNIPLEDFSCDLEVLELSEKKYASGGFMRAIADDYMVATVRVKNTSRETWRRDRNEDNWLNVRLGYRWFREGDDSAPIFEGRADLPADIPPGGEAELEFFVERPEGVDEDCVLRVSLLQEGHAWFFERTDNAFVDLAYPEAVTA